jgi:hypothetical protein
MKRFIKIIGVLLLVIVGFVCYDWFAPKHDLRAFDAAEVGKLDTDMWRSYYERRETRLFRELITLLRGQFGMTPLEATKSAYHAARAAFVFKDGKNRTDYEKALPDIEEYYEEIADRSQESFDPEKVAKLELEWWILHRERSPELANALAELQSAIYGVPAEKFAEHARLRAEAMVLRDDRSTEITDEDWRRIGDTLNRSWQSLHEAVNTTDPLRSSSAGR